MHGSNDNRIVPFLFAALLTVDGLHFVFARQLVGVLPPVTSAMFVTGIASLVMLVYAAWNGKLRPQTFLRHAPMFLSIGALVAVSTTLGYTAVGFIDPGTAALIQQVVVIFGVAIGVVWLKERLSARQVGGAVACLAGVGVITFQPGDYLRAGALLIVTASFCYALHAAIAKRYGSDIDFVEFFLWRVVTMTVCLFAASLVLGQLRLPQSPAGYGLLTLTGVVDVVVSRSLYYLTLRRLPVSLFTLGLTLGPVMAMIWSNVLFGVQPTAQQIAGGAVVLSGVLIVSGGRQ